MPMSLWAIATRVIKLQYNPLVSPPFVQSDPSRTEEENKHDRVVAGPSLCFLRSVAAQQANHLCLCLFSQTQGCGVAARYTITCGHRRVCCLTEDVCVSIASGKRILKTEAARGFLVPETLPLES